MRYLAIVGIIFCTGMIVSCFMPWTYHADIDKTFTGFFSEKNIYGRPGRYFTLFSLFCILAFASKNRVLKWAQFFVSGVMMAYAIKTYILFTSCYNAYCPEKKAGIYLVLFLSILIFLSSSLRPVASRMEADKGTAKVDDAVIQ
ncbi:MAG: hypothetical protein WAT19_12730 [Ferruginibacter sp.]